MMTDRPRVSVVLPCLNARAHLSRCLDSLQAQAYDNFEVLAVDDGSSDGTRELLSAYARRDSRIHVFSNTKTLGLVRSLNDAVARARGDYVARLDADDEADSLRLLKQVQYLDAHPEVDVVSASVLLVNEQGAGIGRRPARVTRPVACRYMLAFANSLIHPSVAARTTVLREFPYSTDARALHTEDYELWSRMSRAGKRLANQRDYLVRYRVAQSSVSRRHTEKQNANFLSCVQAHLQEEFGLELPPSHLRVLANRVDPNRRSVPLAEGLHCLRRLTAQALEQFGVTDADRREIRDAHLMQRLDILLQSVLKGHVYTRLRAASLLLPGLAAAAARTQTRDYVMAKLDRRSTPARRTAHGQAIAG
jgi:hypothetical protein